MNLLEEASNCLKIVDQFSASPQVRSQVEASPLAASAALTQLIAFFRTRTHARDVFLGVLKSFSVKPKERTQLEEGARFFAIVANRSGGMTMRSIAMPKVGWMDKYLEYVQKFERMFKLAVAVIVRGDACTEDQFCTARCFRLVNTGHFPSSTMLAVQKVVDHAAQLLDQHGFGVLCYGDVNITQTVAQRKTVLAFYTPNNDEMYVRANLKGEEGAALHTIIHEIGHRLEHRFMSRELMNDFARVYRAYQHKLHANTPSYKQAVEHNGEIYLYNPRRGATKLEFIHQDEFNKPNARAIHTSIEWWARKQGIVDPFPSDYSKVSLGEFFAEVFAFYIEGRMTQEQKSDFSTLMGLVRLQAVNKAAAMGQKVAGMTRGRASVRGRRRRAS